VSQGRDSYHSRVPGNVEPKRPRPLWIAIITLYFQTLTNAAVGVLLLYLADVEADHGREAPELSVVGYVSLLIAVLLLICAVLLTRGLSWARHPVVVIELLGILSGVISIVAGVVLCVLVLANLSHSDVREWFGPPVPSRSEWANE
jgi:hypothetical protein